MQEPLHNRPDVVVAINLTEVIQWLPAAWRQQPASTYNEALVDIVKICIEDGSDEAQRLRTYLYKTIGFDSMNYICHVVEQELARAVINLDAESLLRIVVMPSEPDMPGVLWLHMPNPLYVGHTGEY